MTKIYGWVQHRIYHGLFTEILCDVWGVETWRMNQSELDGEPGSTKDKRTIMGPVSLQEKATSSDECQISHNSSNTTRTLTGTSQRGRTLTPTSSLPDSSSSGLCDVISLWEMM